MAANGRCFRRRHFRPKALWRAFLSPGVAEGEAFAFHADEGGLTEHDVVEDGDAEEIAGCDELLRDEDVLWAGARVTGGVVVRDDDPGGVEHDGLAEDFAGAQIDVGNAAGDDAGGADEAVLGVEGEDEHFLFRLAHDAGSKEPKDGFGRVHEGAGIGVHVAGAAAQFDGGGNLSGFGRPKPPDAL